MRQLLLTPRGLRWRARDCTRNDRGTSAFFRTDLCILLPHPHHVHLLTLSNERDAVVLAWLGLKRTGRFSLWAFGRRYKKNCKRTPFTCGLLEQMTEATGTTVGDIKFSLMQPGTVVRPHTGPSNQRIRVHLGLEVPPQGCAITVGGETRSWTEGGLVIFDGEHFL